jgi:hypothetical protein
MTTSPRASSRRSAARSRPATRGSDPSSARCRSVSRSPSSDAAEGEAQSSVRGRPRGGSTSDSARAGVEQYSSAIQSASRTSSAGIESSRTDVGVTSFSGGTEVSPASPTTTPSSACRPNGTRTIEPTSTGASGSA